MKMYLETKQIRPQRNVLVRTCVSMKRLQIFVKKGNKFSVHRSFIAYFEGNKVCCGS